MKQKPFDKSLYKKYDEKAKQLFENIAPIEYTVSRNPCKTGVDLLIYKNGKLVAYAEVEMKIVWKGKFKWDTIHLPSRKIKYCGLKHKTLFILFRSDGKQYFCFWDRVILRSNLINVPNKYMHKEEFYDIKLTRRGVYMDIKEAFKELE